LLHVCFWLFWRIIFEEIPLFLEVYFLKFFLFFKIFFSSFMFSFYKYPVYYILFIFYSSYLSCLNLLIYLVFFSNYSGIFNDNFLPHYFSKLNKNNVNWRVAFLFVGPLVLMRGRFFIFDKSELIFNIHHFRAKKMQQSLEIFYLVN